MSAQGEAIWADVAEAIFAERAAAGGAAVDGQRIATADYPTPARRPANSRLDSGTAAADPWRHAAGVARLAPACVQRLLTTNDGSRRP